MPVFRAVGFCGNMVVDVGIVSPSIVSRSEAMEKMASSTSLRFRGAVRCPWLSLVDRVSST